MHRAHRILAPLHRNFPRRRLALGASYDDYMMNWIADQPLAKKFKALVCHDGIFSTYNMFASDAAANTVDDFGKRL